jgi:hypothetical protein
VKEYEQHWNTVVDRQTNCFYIDFAVDYGTAVPSSGENVKLTLRIRIKIVNIKSLQRFIPSGNVLFAMQLACL